MKVMTLCPFCSIKNKIYVFFLTFNLLHTFRYIHNVTVYNPLLFQLLPFYFTTYFIAILLFDSLYLLCLHICVLHTYIYIIYMLYNFVEQILYIFCLTKTPNFPKQNWNERFLIVLVGVLLVAYLVFCTFLFKTRNFSSAHSNTSSN